MGMSLKGHLVSLTFVFPVAHGRVEGKEIDSELPSVKEHTV